MPGSNSNLKVCVDRNMGNSTKPLFPSQSGIVAPLALEPCCPPQPNLQPTMMPLEEIRKMALLTTGIQLLHLYSMYILWNPVRGLPNAYWMNGSELSGRQNMTWINLLGTVTFVLPCVQWPLKTLYFEFHTQRKAAKSVKNSHICLTETLQILLLPTFAVPHHLIILSLHIQGYSIYKSPRKMESRDRKSVV